MSEVQDRQGILDSDKLTVLQHALDDACKAKEDELLRQSDRGEKARAIAAKAIISMALEGACDGDRLRKYAAQALTKSLA